VRILVTFPGKFGDTLWALPTVRLIAEAFDQPVDLALSERYGPDGFRALLRHQPYLGRVIRLLSWEVQQTAPITPWQPPSVVDGADYDQVFHLGYRQWPMAPSLPIEVWQTAITEYRVLHEALPLDLGLDRPWIRAPYRIYPAEIVVGFTDEWFELKYGLYQLLWVRFAPSRAIVNLSTSPRWSSAETASPVIVTWIAAAAWLAEAHVFVGCCSALHVLACAMGTPAVIVEPAAARHHPIFWPYGQDGPRVTLVRGGDGLPTFDARHLGDAIEAALARRPAKAIA